MSHRVAKSVPPQGIGPKPLSDNKFYIDAYRVFAGCCQFDRACLAVTPKLASAPFRRWWLPPEGEQGAFRNRLPDAKTDGEGRGAW